MLWLMLVGMVKSFLPVWKKKDVTQEIVLITGAGSGIGKLMALKFAKLGAKVVLWDINEEGNETVMKEIKAEGGVAHAYKVDCSKKEDVYASAVKVHTSRHHLAYMYINNSKCWESYIHLLSCSQVGFFWLFFFLVKH